MKFELSRMIRRSRLLLICNMQFIFSKDLHIWMYASCLDKIGFGIYRTRIEHENAFWSNGYSSGEGRKLFRVYYVTLNSLPPVPSPESLSYSPDVSCSSSLEVRLLAARVFASFPKNYSINYCIDVCDILQFRALHSYNNGTVRDSVHFLLLPIISYTALTV